MKRGFAVFAAAVVMISSAACGDKDSESSSSSISAGKDSKSSYVTVSEDDDNETSSAEILNGTYRFADIDGFGYLEDGPEREYIVLENGRFESFYYNDADSDKDYYKKYGYELKSTGTYEFSDGVISLKFDDINTKEELFEQHPPYLDIYNNLNDSEKESYVEKMINYHREIRAEAGNKSGTVDEEKSMIYLIDDPHFYRRAVYRDIASKTFVSNNGSSYGGFYYDFYAHIAKTSSYDADKYYFFSSDDELNDNVSDEDREYLEGIINELVIPDEEYYTAEEGFTRNIDISKYSWLYVTKGTEYAAFALGENVDSDMFGEIPHNDDFHSMRDVYNYYKSLS